MIAQPPPPRRLLQRPLCLLTSPVTDRRKYIRVCRGDEIMRAKGQKEGMEKGEGVKKGIETEEMEKEEGTKRGTETEEMEKGEGTKKEN